MRIDLDKYNLHAITFNIAADAHVLYELMDELQDLHDDDEIIWAQRQAKKLAGVSDEELILITAIAQRLQEYGERSSKLLEFECKRRGAFRIAEFD